MAFRSEGCRCIVHALLALLVYSCFVSLPGAFFEAGLYDIFFA